MTAGTYERAVRTEAQLRSEGLTDAADVVAEYVTFLSSRHDKKATLGRHGEYPSSPYTGISRRPTLAFRPYDREA